MSNQARDSPMRDENESSEYELVPPQTSQNTADISQAGPPPAPPTLSYRGRPAGPPRGADEETIKNFYMPLWLLGVGAAIEVIAMLLRGRAQLTASLVHVGVEIGVGTAFMLIGVMLSARLRGISLGPFRATVFKLAAISVAPTAALTLLSPALMFIPFGGLIGAIGQFILYFALLGALFDLDESDTWFCVWVIFLIHLAVYLPLLWSGLLKR